MNRIVPPFTPSTSAFPQTQVTCIRGPRQTRTGVRTFNGGRPIQIALWAILAILFIPLKSAVAQLTIMPMGDSITVGVDNETISAGGYRDPLYRDLTGAGISFVFEGAANTNTTGTLNTAGQSYHNGYGGWHITDINANLDGVALPIDGGDANQGGYFLTGGHGTGRPAVYPNILLLHVGTNDMLQGSQTMQQDLYTLVTHIHALTPQTIILIAGIIPIDSPSFIPQVVAYNSYIQNQLVPQLSYTRFVNQYASFLNSDGSVNGALLGTDLIHPNRFGYPVLALNWAAAIEAVEGISPASNPLTVSNGTGSGNYTAGSIVTVSANAPGGGTQFSTWTPGTIALANPFASLTTYTMPASAANITASYAAAGSPILPNGTYNIVSYWDGLSVSATGATDASGVQQQPYGTIANQSWDAVNLGNNVVSLKISGTNEALEVPSINISSYGAYTDVATYTGATNQQWTISPGFGSMQIVNVASGQALDIAGYSTTPGAPLLQETPGTQNGFWDFFPVSGAQPSYTLTVNNGTGGGTYAVGTTVTVTANAPAQGMQFSGWTGATTYMANPSAATTTLVTSASDSSITATYSALPVICPLTVNNGTGSGMYTAGTVVSVTANSPATGMQFAGWSGANVASGSSPATTLVMPGAATTLTATYTAVPVTTPAPVTVSTPAPVVSGASSSIVGVQFVGGGAAPLHGPYYDYTAGAPSYSMGNWNSVLRTDDTTLPQALTMPSGLTDSTGAASAIGFQLASSGAYYTGAGSGFTGSPLYPGYPGALSGVGDSFLFAGFAYAGYSDRNPVTLNITGLNASHAYSILVYVTPFEQFGDGQSATVSLAGGSSYYVAAAGKLGIYQRVTSTSPTNPGAGNYVEFDNVTGSATQTIQVTNTSLLVGISGFQVVDTGTASTVSSDVLTVNQGSGSGSYAPGTVVPVVAATPATGFQFAGWTGTTSILANPAAASTTATLSSASAAITATYTPTSSTIVGVQFVGGGAGPLHGTNFDYTAGEGPFATGNWNPVLATGNTRLPQTLTMTSGLTDSTGAASPIGFKLQSNGAYYTGAGWNFPGSPLYPGFPGRTSGAGDAFLYAGFAFAGYTNAQPAALTVTGLNATHTYSLLVYFAPFEGFGNSQSASIALTGGATYYVNTNGGGGTYQNASSTDPANPGTGNYVEYDNLTGAASQTITFTNTSMLVGMSGFQIVDMGAGN